MVNSPANLYDFSLTFLKEADLKVIVGYFSASKKSGLVK